jgi:integrase
MKTLADLKDYVAGSKFSATRKRDATSAIDRFCNMVQRLPASVPLDPPELRRLLNSIRPAAHGISRRTLSNIRWLIASTLHAAGQLDGLHRGLAKGHPAWRPFMEAIAKDKALRSGLASFNNYCAAGDIQPAEVSDLTLKAFLEWLEAHTLHPKPRELARRIPMLWKRAQSKIEGWPHTTLSRLSFRRPSDHLSWSQLPDTFQRDAEAYLAMRRQPDPFEESVRAPRRPLADKTLRQHREHLRLSASVLINSKHISPNQIALRHLVEVEAFKCILRHYNQKANGEANAFATCLAKTLIQVAWYQVGADDQHVDRLRAIARRLPEPLFDLTPKNKSLLRLLEPKQTRAKLLFLPERLLSDVMKDLEGGRVRFVDAQCAVAIDILLFVPLRPQNLGALHWQRHFQELGTSRGLLLHIPANETKTGKEILAEIPEEVARRIRWYRRHVLAHLGADPNGFLFVAKGGERKHQKTLAGQLIDVIARYVGVHMTPHQFRHFAATAYLEAHPEDFETLRSHLGHAWARTTLIYAGNSTRRSGRVYGRFLMRTREELRVHKPRHKASKSRKNDSGK